MTGPADSSAAAPLVVVRDLMRHFDISPSPLARLIQRQERVILKAVDGVSFAIQRGGTFSLVGESGCGKSTVARLLVGLFAPTGGSILFDGHDLAKRQSRRTMSGIRRRLQMIFQDPYASLNPRWRVQDIVAEPIRAFKLASGREIDHEVSDLLAQVGLGATDRHRYPHEFSGGQRQRISIARALAGKPDFLVCDEPTSALDVSVQAQILNLMKELQRRHGLTILFISHNLAVVDHVSDEVGVMYLGRLCEIATPRQIFRRPRHPYTRMLIDTIPDLEMSGRTRSPVTGEVASPINPPSGCAFHPRCRFANERCRQERPALLPDPVTRTLVACHAARERRLPLVEPGSP